MWRTVVSKTKFFQRLHSYKFRTSPSSTETQHFASSVPESKLQGTDSTAKKNVLSSFGFSEKECEKILESCSLRGPLSSECLLESLTFWSSLELEQHALNPLLTNNTDVLYVPPHQCVKVYQFIASNFSRGQVKKIFLNSPQVVHRNPRGMESCLKFLEVDKKVDRQDIANSGALAHPLNYIHVRFEFLERAGLYTVPSKKITPNNPKLSAIVNSSDKEFATKIAGLSLEEYEVFEELLDKEDESTIALEELD